MSPQGTSIPIVLNKEQIESVVESLPIQYRIMIRLLLLQYLEITQENIEHIASDRPDPRFQLGEKPKHHVLSRHAVESVADRVEQYRLQVRQKRERLWLQIECLAKQIALSEALCKLTEELLGSRFGFAPEAIQGLKNGASTVVPKPALRALEKKWDREEFTEDEYRRDRLPIEYQTELRRLDRYRRRLDIAKREFTTVGHTPLQDHEIAHIWGIPLGSLAARKVKALHNYLQSLQAKMHQADSASSDATIVDLWKETLTSLSTSPVQRSTGLYDGTHGTEGALLDKLAAFAAGALPEEVESRFWQTASRDNTPNAVEGQGKRQSLFALQRLSAILSEIDPSSDALEQELLAKVSPTPKVKPGESVDPAAETQPQISEMAEHVLRSFRGEDRS